MDAACQMKALLLSSRFPLKRRSSQAVSASKTPMIKTINDVMPSRAMPKSHQCHRDDISHIRGGVAILEPFIFQRGEDEAVVNVIAEPERQTHMPAIPKIADVARKEWTVEIFRGVNAEQITKSHRKGAVTGKIEEQIKGISVHVRADMQKIAALRHRIEPILLD